jgi:hypothetical protein
MPSLGPPWAFLGLFAGIWKLAIVTGVAATVLWRTGLWNHPLVRLLRPWTSPTRSAGTVSARPPAPHSLRSDRIFWFFTIVAATAVAAWIVTRMTISGSVHSPLSH